MLPSLREYGATSEGTQYRQKSVASKNSTGLNFVPRKIFGFGVPVWKRSRSQVSLLRTRLLPYVQHSKLSISTKVNIIVAQFVDLGLSPWLIKNCREMGLTNPTPVQENCIPQILAGGLQTLVPSRLMFWPRKGCYRQRQNGQWQNGSVRITYPAETC